MKAIATRSLVPAGCSVGGVLALATVALAVPPPPDSVFQGNTSQLGIERHGVEVDTDASGHVSAAYIQWQAKCKKKGQVWTSTTKVANGPGGLAQSGDTFSRTKTYTAKAGGSITGKLTYTFKGAFDDADNAAGTFKSSVIVKRKGKKIDSCKLKKITWTASRVAEEG